MAGFHQNHRLTPGIVLVTAAVMVGMVIDRYWGVSSQNWLVAGLLLGATIPFVLLLKMRQVLGLILLGECLVVGGARHHQVWSVIAPIHISNFATEELEPIVLVGRVASKPWVTTPETNSPFVGWTQQTKTRFDLNCFQIVEANKVRDVSGKIRVSVLGDKTDLNLNDEIRLRGDIVLPSPPRNPGEFDYRKVLRRQNILVVMRCKTEHSIETLASKDQLPSTHGSLPNLTQPVRDYIDGVLTENLSAATLPLAQSLILGTRDGLDDATREAFLLSGSMHLLAISGLHVGILLFGLFAVLKLAGFSFRMQMLLTMAFLLAFLCLTEIRPSVVRAVTTASLFAFGMLLSRPISLIITLCGALLIIVMVDPPALFEVGTHLSFHSVAAILFGMKLWQRLDPVRIPTIGSEEVGWIGFLVGIVKAYFRDGYFVTLAVFIGTAPLIMTAFHLIAPIGYVLGVFMIPVLASALLVGYASLVVDGIFPLAGEVVFRLFDVLLQFLLSFVEFAAEIPGGHWRTTSLGWTGCWVYYCVFYGLAYSMYLSRPLLFRCLLRCSCIIVIGFSVVTTFVPRHTTGDFRATFVSVGHGLAVLLQCPNGKTLLYDAGSIQFGPNASRSVEAVMAESGIDTLDAIVVSHSDIDHFNAVPALLNRVKVRELLISQACLQAGELGPIAVCDIASRKGVSIRLLQRGDKLNFDQSVKMRVLHPSGRHENWSSDDNANSLVVDVEYADRTLLISGDIEFDGLAELVENYPPSNYDVVLSPHHGSLRANTEDFIAWANPQIVVASEIDASVIGRLNSVFGPKVEVYSTAGGAVTLTFAPGKNVTIQQFRAH